uniref:Uncharacterized protein n=1 Tax=Arundo donax TaxID=35708 RepID=A0A0A9AMH4_ARUDO
MVIATCPGSHTFYSCGYKYSTTTTIFWKSRANNIPCRCIPQVIDCNKVPLML